MVWPLFRLPRGGLCDPEGYHGKDERSGSGSSITLCALKQPVEPTAFSERKQQVYRVSVLRGSDVWVSDCLGCAPGIGGRSQRVLVVFRRLPEALNESQYLVPRMTREQLCEAIKGPAELGGVEVASSLLEELLNKTGDDPDQLPVLQHLLMRMWEIREPTGMASSINEKQYSAVGGWDDALNRHADEVWERLPDDRKIHTRRLFQRLTERGQAGREVRRPAMVRELMAVAEVGADEIKAVVEQYREEGCNFLTSPDRELTEDSVIDISHESLIRRWKLLKHWVEEEADWGEWYRRVEDRKWIKGSYLVDPELDLALQAQRSGRWNEAWAQRYVTQRGCSSLAYTDVVGFLEESERERKGGSIVYFGLLLSRMIPETEQKHLFNLADGMTKEYTGRSSLQSELRHLAESELLMRRPGRGIGDMKRGTIFDLADYVELTALGRFWIDFQRRKRNSGSDVA